MRDERACDRFSEVTGTKALRICGGRILWVEGHKDLSAALAQILQDDGFEVVSATSAAAGLQLAQDQRFDLYFFDLSLPGMTGVELLRSIREFDEDTPILFISGRAIDAEKRQAAACELLDCCMEPSDFATLKQTIHSLLDGFSKQELYKAACAK
jgi:DNA-binding response OmpR family regulator